MGKYKRFYPLIPVAFLIIFAMSYIPFGNLGSTNATAHRLDEQEQVAFHSRYRASAEYFPTTGQLHIYYNVTSYETNEGLVYDQADTLGLEDENGQIYEAIGIHDIRRQEYMLEGRIDYELGSPAPQRITFTFYGMENVSMTWMLDDAQIPSDSDPES